jgi:hypothetical protein
METRASRILRLAGTQGVKKLKASKAPARKAPTRKVPTRNAPTPFKRVRLLCTARKRGNTRMTIKTVDWMYEVEKVLDARFGKNGVPEYLVKWAGYPHGDNMWVEELPIFFKRQCVLLLYKAAARVSESESDSSSESESDSSSESESDSSSESESESDYDTDGESESESEAACCKCRCHL